jgi:hypothetical protein
MSIFYYVLLAAAIAVFAVIVWLVYMFIEFANALEALELP